jgi:hypothetical protein
VLYHRTIGLPVTIVQIRIRATYDSAPLSKRVPQSLTSCNICRATQWRSL